LLCMRVKAPTQYDWQNLMRLLKYLNGTRQDKLTLTTDDLHIVKWYVDASFAVHPDFKSHTGGVMTFGGGAVQSISRKQKLNTRSSTEAELVAADNASTLNFFLKPRATVSRGKFCFKTTSPLPSLNRMASGVPP